MPTTPPPASVPDRLLDATVEAAAAHGLTRLSVGDVARQAGLSRQTLYKHFPSKDALVAAAVLRESQTMVAQIVAAADTHDDLQDALEAAIFTTLVLTREHPLLDRLVRTEPEALLPLLLSDGGPVTMTVRAVVEAIVDQRIPALSPLELRRTADLLSRVLISYAVSAPDDPPEEVARFMAALLTGGILTADPT